MEKCVRRVLRTDYKLSILKQADACQYGELCVILRREKLYSNQIAKWLREFSLDGVEGQLQMCSTCFEVTYAQTYSAMSSVDRYSLSALTPTQCAA